MDSSFFGGLPCLEEEGVFLFPDESAVHRGKPWTNRKVSRYGCVIVFYIGIPMDTP